MEPKEWNLYLLRQKYIVSIPDIFLTCFKKINLLNRHVKLDKLVLHIKAKLLNRKLYYSENITITKLIRNGFTENNLLVILTT
jgi:hypothetical protein